MIAEKSVFICPICKGSLFKTENSFKCLKCHSFDLSKDGYVNLLLKNGQGKRHGDDKIMIKARRDFLQKNYYDNLRNAVSDVLGNDHTMLDAGCGEGYYTSIFEKENCVYGIDISKDAIKYASKICRSTQFAVASLFEIPLPSGSVDTVVNIFAPDSHAEFNRVLSPGGRLIMVFPMEKHLWELKEAIYTTPYLNPAVNTQRDGMKLNACKELKFKMKLSSNEDVVALFKMTPYYYKTSANDQLKTESINNLDVTAEFLIAEYVKTDDM